MRLVTLLPSATEIVCALGLQRCLVGVSHSCNYPAGVADLPVMTSTHVPYAESSQVIDTCVRRHLTAHEALYDLNMERLIAAKPDFILSQALCDVCAVSTGDVMRAISDLPSKPQLIDLNPHTLSDVLNDIENVGDQLQVDGVPLLASLRTRLDAVRHRTATIPQHNRPLVAFLEWLIPPFNGGHWNPELVELAGGIDLLGNAGEPSTTQSWQRIVDLQPEVLFVACCGLQVDRALEDVRQASKTTLWQQIPAVRDGRVYIADGNAYFSCPGPRLVDGLEIMAHALHPEAHPGLWPQAPAWP